MRAGVCSRENKKVFLFSSLASYRQHAFYRFQVVNVVAATNRQDADRDLRLPRRDDEDDVWIDDAGSQEPIDVSQSSATTSTSSRKRKKIKELCHHVRYRSADAKYVAELGPTATGVHITTIF